MARRRGRGVTGGSGGGGDEGSGLSAVECWWLGVCRLRKL